MGQKHCPGCPDALGHFPPSPVGQALPHGVDVAEGGGGEDEGAAPVSSKEGTESELQPALSSDM